MIPGTPAAKRPVIYFYRKAECHLCENMARELGEFMGSPDAKTAEIVERDIEDDPRWHARYREYVPVLVVDRREICHYFFDRDELKAALVESNDKQ